MDVLTAISTSESVFIIDKEQMKIFESLGVGRVQETESKISIHLSKKDKIKVIDHFTVGKGGSGAIDKIEYERLN